MSGSAKPEGLPGGVLRWLEAPRFADEARTRLAWLTNTAIGVSLLASMAPIPGEGLARCLLVAGPLLLVKVVLNRGLVEWAARGLALVMFVYTTVLGFGAGGISAPHMSGYVLLVFGTGLVLGTRSAILAAGASLAAGMGLVIAERQGSLPALTSSPLRDLGVLAVTLGVAAVFVGVARSALELSLVQVRRELAERTEAERALHYANAELRLALESGRMGTWSWNAETGALSWSAEAHRITNGLTRGFEGGLPEFLSFVHADDREAFDRAVAQALVSSRNPQRFEARLVLPGGEERWFELRGQAFEDETGPSGVVGTIADVDDRRRVEDEREALVKELGTRNSELERFTYTVSHDLKSPLITIRGFLGFLAEDAVAGRVDRIKDDTARIVDATIKMQRLLEELLDLSRVGRKSEASESFDGNQAAEEAVSLVRGRLEACGARVEIQKGLPTLFGDRQRIVQVLQNLIDNAASFMGAQPSPRIVVGVRSDRTWPVITVKDNGIGIAPEYAERVFGLFEKLDPRSGGTGVGLSLVKRIVEHHGGEVWVESDGDGMGSTFCVTLPPPPMRPEAG